MVELFLSGGGSGKQTRELDKLFISNIPNGKRVLYIPVASRRSNKGRTFGSCWYWFMGDFAELGFSRVDMWTSLENRSFDDLKRYGAVYFGGGKTPDLLQEVHATKFDVLLKRYMRRGGIVFGGSAGAIIFGKTIRAAVFGTDPDRDWNSIRNLNGMNGVRNYSISCHYTSADDDAIVDFVRKKKEKVISLSEETGLHVCNGKIRVVGRKPAHVFSSKGKRAVRPNEWV